LKNVKEFLKLYAKVLIVVLVIAALVAMGGLEIGLIFYIKKWWSIILGLLLVALEATILFIISENV
jgi:hypothetical protein